MLEALVKDVDWTGQARVMATIMNAEEYSEAR